MPHQSVKLVPGVNVTDTPALNQAGVSQSQLIRYVPDTANGGVIQKLGGWTKFYGNTTSAIVRALWAWMDTEAVAHLAFGTETSGGGTAQLGVITNGNAINITPRYAADDVTPAASSTSGSSYVTITDATTGGITNYDTVFIATQIAIGGVVLYGLYPCDPNGYIGPTTYTVQAINTLGQPQAATATSSSPVLPLFSTTSGNASVQVTLPNHGLAVGDRFPVLLSTTVGGSTFVGPYPVQTVIDADNFTIVADTLPTSTTTGYLNGNLAHFIYGFGVGAIPHGTGYGVGGYGTGGYGTGTAVVPATGTAIDATDWTLDNWGENLIACPIRTATNPQYQPIYIWDAIGGSPTATVIGQGPSISDGIFVAMPQRQIVAWGTTFDGIADPLLIRWCDVNDYTTWLGTVTNQAGSYRLAKGSKIVGALQTPQQGLIWTDIGVWSMQYTGPPYIYSFNEIGSGCGMIGRKAAGSLGGVVYWMGASQFFMLGGEGVQPLPCPVWDVVFQDIDTTHASRIRCAVNSRFGEIAWYYPTISSGGEVTAYVKFNAYLGVWDYGTLGRSAWVDQSVLGAPIGADPASLYLYQHETSTDADGAPLLASFQSGYAALSEGDQKMFVDQVWPDAKWSYYGSMPNATLQITFYVTDYPGQTPRIYGPYSVTQATTYISPRFRGRLVAVNVSSSDTGSFWRLGNIRYRVKPDGVF